MAKTSIPKEWDLYATRRYKRENMERAMRGEIERGLVELITNCDDKYLELEEQGIQSSGKILIEIERKRTQPTIVIVRDRAVGMSRKELYEKMGGLGGRTSGSERVKNVVVYTGVEQKMLQRLVRFTLNALKPTNIII